jgi:uncharacterized protein (DUF1778 family)
MAANETQLSAFVTTETKEQLDRYTRQTGVKKGHVINEALQHHLRALSEIPSDMIVHSRIVLSAESGAKVLAMLEAPANPTPALRALMKRPR